MTKLSRLTKPTLDQAKEFFAWNIEKTSVFGHDGRELKGWSEFRSSKGNTLHVGNDSYCPAQPGKALEIAIDALNQIDQPWTVESVGSFGNDANIFAQFKVGEDSTFKVNGKDVNNLITMAKGNDETLPLDFWDTFIYIICQNSFRHALCLRSESTVRATLKQSKNSDQRINKVAEKLVYLLTEQQAVKEELVKLSTVRCSTEEAEKAFLGLLKLTLGSGEIEFGKTGKTRLTNSLERYKNGFTNSPGVLGQTREDWLNAVTWVDTHGNTESKRFDADKQFVSSEFGSRSQRKSRAFEVAINQDSWNEVVSRGGEIRSALLV